MEDQHQEDNHSAFTWGSSSHDSPAFTWSYLESELEELFMDIGELEYLEEGLFKRFDEYLLLAGAKAHPSSLAWATYVTNRREDRAAVEQARKARAEKEREIKAEERRIQAFLDAPSALKKKFEEEARRKERCMEYKKVGNSVVGMEKKSKEESQCKVCGRKGVWDYQYCPDCDEEW